MIRKETVDVIAYAVPAISGFTPINNPDEEPAAAAAMKPSAEMMDALKVLDGAKSPTLTPSAAVNVAQQQWFKLSSTKQSNADRVASYVKTVVDNFSSASLLARLINLQDVNGNTALHYAVSHGNLDIVDILIDTKVADANVVNKAGYTCVMLVSLLDLPEKAVISRLFAAGDVNERAKGNGQTALMLAVSNDKLSMAEMLLENGADVNVRDDDGSTALMCAAEHGHMDAVKLLLKQADVNVLAKDKDGLTALAVAMEAGWRDVGVVLYAHMSFANRGGGSPLFASLRIKRPSGSEVEEGEEKERRSSMSR